MPIVTFLPDGKNIVVAAGTTILEASRLAGVLIEAPCNGAGHCGKCAVRVAPDSLDNLLVHLDAQHADIKDGVVLACHAEIYGDIAVETEQRAEEGLRVIDSGTGIKTEVHPFVTGRYDTVNNTTVIYAGDNILAIESGDTTASNFGLVVDIGTTTLVAVLVDLGTGRELATASGLNPQSVHAQDVLSRISFAKDKSGLDTLQGVLVEELNRLIAEISTKSGIDTRYIYEAVFSGNTCMLHIVAGIDPAPLGRHPFLPTLTGGVHLPAEQIGLSIAPQGLIYLPPVISAYVGADISTGILASGLSDLSGVTLFIDIGTNGELALAVDGNLSASATAAGPAFEGMNISCGMRASAGAVERIDIDAAGGLDIGVIGGVGPVGICGSGLMDLTAELVRHGVIAESGRLKTPPDISPALAPRLEGAGSKAAFRFGDSVTLTQKDIRQVQLAKGAIRAGIEMLLKDAGLDACRLDRVLIAGSFGFHLREESLITMGLLPPEAAGKVSFLGNTSRSGGEMLLINHSLRGGLTQLVGNVNVVDLAGNPAFERAFMEFMSFKPPLKQ